MCKVTPGNRSDFLIYVKPYLNNRLLSSRIKKLILCNGKLPLDQKLP